VQSELISIDFSEKVNCVGKTGVNLISDMFEVGENTKFIQSNYLKNLIQDTPQPSNATYVFDVVSSVYIVKSNNRYMNGSWFFINKRKDFEDSPEVLEAVIVGYGDFGLNRNEFMLLANSPFLKLSNNEFKLSNNLHCVHEIQ